MMEVVQLIQVELPEKSGGEDSLTPLFVILIKYYERTVQFPVPSYSTGA